MKHRIFVRHFIKIAYESVFHGTFGIYARFLFSGGSAAVVDLSLLYLFTDILGWWYLYSATAAFIAAMFVSFTLQKFWTFKDERTEAPIINIQGALYVSVALINMTMNNALLYFFVDILGWWHIAAQVVAGFAIAIVSFFSYRAFIFKRGMRKTSAL